MARHREGLMVTPADSGRGFSKRFFINHKSEVPAGRAFGGFLSHQHLNNMGTEKKNGAKIETKVAPSLKEKFARKVKKNGTSQAQVVRDLIQGYVKK